MVVETIVPLLICQVLRAHVAFQLGTVRVALYGRVPIFFLMLFLEILIEFGFGIGIHLLVEIFEQSHLLFL